MTIAARPRVSIALPVYNGAHSIAEPLESALAQTFGDLEIVVVDNASTDDTVEIVRSYADERIRVHVNPENVGYHRNMNRSIELSRGELVKFLHADDVLLPACVERLVEVMDAGGNRMALAFSRRRIEIHDESAPDFVNFRRVYESAYEGFGPLEPVNDGRRMLHTWLASGLRENWVGEPSTVMMRRSALQRLGLFNPRMRMIDDLDMWARAMAHYDVGFVDETLVRYRMAPTNMTIQHGVARRWLDRLWMLEGLYSDVEVRAAFPELEDALRAERREVARVLARTARRDPKSLPGRLGQMRSWGAFVARRSLRRAPTLHPPLASS